MSAQTNRLKSDNHHGRDDGTVFKCQDKYEKLF